MAQTLPHQPDATRDVIFLRHARLCIIILDSFLNYSDYLNSFQEAIIDLCSLCFWLAYTQLSILLLVTGPTEVVCSATGPYCIVSVTRSRRNEPILADVCALFAACHNRT